MGSAGNRARHCLGRLQESGEVVRWVQREKVSDWGESQFLVVTDDDREHLWWAGEVCAFWAGVIAARAVARRNAEGENVPVQWDDALNRWVEVDDARRRQPRQEAPEWTI